MEKRKRKVKKKYLNITGVDCCWSMKCIIYLFDYFLYLGAFENLIVCHYTWIYLWYLIKICGGTNIDIIHVYPFVSTVLARRNRIVVNVKMLVGAKHEATNKTEISAVVSKNDTKIKSWKREKKFDPHKSRLFEEYRHPCM